MSDKGPIIDPNHPLARALGVEGGQAEGPPTEQTPHSEFPIPRSWGAAWPLILWGMLAFSLVLVFAESMAALIESPALRAGTSVVALLGVTAMLIYRERLLLKLRNPSPWLIAAIACTTLWVLSASPFIEQKRWPFSVWFPNPITDAEPQKATLIDWLKQAQQERDQTTVERNSAQKSWADDLKKMQAIQSQLTGAQQERDMAQAELAKARKAGEDANNKATTLQKELDDAKKPSPYAGALFPPPTRVPLGTVDTHSSILSLEKSFNEANRIGSAKLRFYENSNSLEIVEKGDAIAKVDIETEQSNITARALPLFSAKFSFKSESGPFDVRASGSGSTAQLSNLNPLSYWVLENTRRHINVSLDLANQKGGVSFSIIPREITITFYKSGS
jgi:hypothetical protein